MRALLAKARRESPRWFFGLFLRRAPGAGDPRRVRPRDEADLLSTLLSLLRPASVVEVGGGAGRMADPADLPDADVVVCLDTFADPAGGAGETDLAGLLRSAGRALVVSGPREPLWAALRQGDPAAEVYPLREAGGIATFLALKAPAGRHPNDFDAPILAGLVGRHPSPLRLVALRLCAWRTIGFYPRHEPRLWEYPVVADRVLGLLPPGSRVVDVGAGVNPLVPYLASQGYSIETVDPSPLHRTWPPRPDWNEWEFLDYAARGLARRSWNCTLDRVPRSPAFDGAYSVSVVEHLPAAERRRLLQEIADRLRPGGLAVLTVDVLRGSEALWNRNRGLEVEEPAAHGTLGDLLSEMSRAGLAQVEIERLEDWGGVPIDPCLIVARRA